MKQFIISFYKSNFGKLIFENYSLALAVSKCSKFQFLNFFENARLGFLIFRKSQAQFLYIASFLY